MQKDTKFKPANAAGVTTRWKKGQSGNPAGISKRRLEYATAYADALMAGISPAAAAALVIKAAKKGESWAIQLLYSRLGPAVIEAPGTTEGIHIEVTYDQQENRLELTGTAPRSEESG